MARSFWRRLLGKKEQAHRGTGGGFLSEDDVADFLLGELLIVSSSNVASATYQAPEHKMIVEYLDGSVWLYGDISDAEAEAFARAPSKGIFIWDHIKVRGTVHEHQKPAWKIR